jgi:hypothetical protein
VVADGHATCILPERSAAAPGLVIRPIEGLFGAAIATVSGSTTPVEMRKIEQLGLLCAAKADHRWLGFRDLLRVAER